MRFLWATALLLVQLQWEREEVSGVTTQAQGWVN